MGAGEGQRLQLSRGTPSVWRWSFHCAVGKFGAKDLHRDSVARDGVLKFSQRLDGERTRAQQTFRQLRGFHPAPVHFDIRKLPKARVDHAGRALADKQAPLAFDHERRKTALR